MTSVYVAKKDENRVPTMIGVSSETITIGSTDFIQDVTPVPIAVNPTTGAVLLEQA